MTRTQIDTILELNADMGWSVEENRSTPHGEPCTYCGYSLSKAEDPAVPIQCEVQKWTRYLQVRRQGLQSMVDSGGRLEYFFGIFLSGVRGGMGGFELEPELLRDIADLNIRLSFDLYGSDPPTSGDRFPFVES